MASQEKIQNPKMHWYDQYNHDKWQKWISIVIKNECLHLQVKKYQIKLLAHGCNRTQYVCMQLLDEHYNHKLIVI
jgi:hypothetical protein